MTLYEMRNTPIRQWEGGTVRNAAIIGFIAALIGAFLTGQFFDAMTKFGAGEAAVYFLLGLCAILITIGGFAAMILIPLMWFVK